MIFYITFFLLLTITILYIVVILKYHDVKLKKLDSKEKENILFIYPHPDDETMMSGGLISRLARNNNVHVVSTTRGENGIELLDVSEEELGDIRINEFKNAVKTLCAKIFEVWDFTDGGSDLQKEEMTEKILQYIDTNKIETVITYERSGVYPHPDHIALSEVVTEIKKERNDLKVIYSTLPKKIKDLAGMPTKITLRDREVLLADLHPCMPEFKVFVLFSNIKKYRAALCYKSQKLNASMPLWVQMLFLPYEYYSIECEMRETRGVT